jgi:hypothetical protein
MGNRKFERMAASGGESTARAGAGVSALHRVSSKITPQMISLSHDIETVHILLEHFYDSRRNENAA